MQTIENKQYKAFLFDLDGVIFDTEPQYTDFWGEVFRTYYPNHEGLELEIKGQTLTQILTTYFADSETIQRDIVAHLNAFEKTMDFSYLPGFLEFIKALHAKSVKTAVVTSSNVPKMNNVYRQHPEFKALFNAILTSEDFTRSKPAPDCYLSAAGRLDVPASQCIGFEDSINGLKSLNAAGIFSVGLVTTLSKEAIEGLAHVTINNYNDKWIHKILQYI